MKSVLLLLVAFSSGSLVPAGRELVRFEPDLGTVVTKKIEIVVENELDEMNMLVNGQPSPMTPELSLHSKQTTSVVVRDAYLAVADGAPEKLTRDYVELARVTEEPVAISMAGQETSADLHASGSSELEGKQVLFAKDGETWSASFADSSDGDDELLEGLVADVDLLALLPDGEVATGDRWDVDPQDLVNVLFPADDLHWTMQSDGDAPPPGFPDPADDPDSRSLLGDLEGEASVTYLETRMDGDTRLAVLEVSIEVSSEKDVVEEFRAKMEGSGMELDSVVYAVEIDAQGVLTWNLAAGRAESFELKGEVQTQVDQEMSMEAGAQSMRLEQAMQLSGTLTIHISFE